MTHRQSSDNQTISVASTAGTTRSFDNKALTLILNDVITAYQVSDNVTVEG